MYIISNFAHVYTNSVYNNGSYYYVNYRNQIEFSLVRNRSCPATFYRGHFLCRYTEICSSVFNIALYSLNGLAKKFVRLMNTLFNKILGENETCVFYFYLKLNKLFNLFLIDKIFKLFPNSSY